jgi:hypothetical protein
MNPYEHQPYPSFRYHATEPPCKVHDAEQDAALGEAWKHSPADCFAAELTAAGIQHGNVIDVPNPKNYKQTDEGVEAPAATTDAPEPILAGKPNRKPNRPGK